MQQICMADRCELCGGYSQIKMLGNLAPAGKCAEMLAPVLF
jgi:hypothetical protein